MLTFWCLPIGGAVLEYRIIKKANANKGFYVVSCVNSFIVSLLGGQFIGYDCDKKLDSIRVF